MHVCFYWLLVLPTVLLFVLVGTRCVSMYYMHVNIV